MARGKMNRRNFLLGTASLAALTISLPSIMLPQADAAIDGSGGAAPDPNLPSQRTMYNVDYTAVGEYIWIDYIAGAFSSGGLGAGIQTNTFNVPGAKTWGQVNFDPVYGWPKDQLTDGNTYGLGFVLPSPDVVSDYTFDGTGEGSGQITPPFGCNCTFVPGSMSANFKEIGPGSGQFSVTDPRGIGWHARFTQVASSSFTAGLPMGLVIRSNNPGNNGKWIGYNGSPRIYETRYASQLAAGELVRPAFKQNIAALNPSAIRFMNWSGGNHGAGGDYGMRWENRSLPKYPGVINNFASPAYSFSSLVASTPNQFKLNSATGMPVSMTHGEVVVFRCDVSTTNRDPSGFNAGSVISVSAEANGLCTWNNHPWQNGDRLIWRCANEMPLLDYCHGTVSSVTTNTFRIGINTTGMPAWVTAAHNTGYIHEYVTMNVGGRGEFPVNGNDGYSTIVMTGGLAARNYYTFYFNKNAATIKTTPGPAPTYPGDPAANLTFGVWISPGGGATGVSLPYAGVPIEKIVAVVNEVNDVYTAQGHGGPTHLYLNCPGFALMSTDPDYSSGSSYSTHQIQTAFNGSTYNGVTYKGLTSKANLFLEYWNETWNAGAKAVCSWFGSLRGFSISDLNDYTTLRSGVMATDIKAVINNPRLKFVTGMQFADLGYPGGAIGTWKRIWGSQGQGADPMNTWAQQAVFNANNASGDATLLTVNSVASGTIKVGQWVAKDIGYQGSLTSERIGFITQQLSQSNGDGPGLRGTYRLSRPTALVSRAFANTDVYSQFVPFQVFFDYLASAPYIDPPSYPPTWNDIVVVPSGGKGLPAMADDYAANPSHRTADINAWMVGMVSALNAADRTYATNILGIMAYYLPLYTRTLSFLTTQTGTKKYVICYEGGWDPLIDGLGTNITAFLTAAHNSTQWRDAWISFVNQWSATPGAAMPGEYTRSGSRWSHILPPNAVFGVYDSHLGSDEYGHLDAAWAGLVARNAGLA
jgi:hypothetical protein